MMNIGINLQLIRIIPETKTQKKRKSFLFNEGIL